MRNRIRTWLAILSLWLPVSCASLITDRTEEIFLNSVPPGANVVVNGAVQVQTPGRIRARKDSKLYFQFTKEGYQEELRTLDTKFSTSLLLNLGLVYFAPVGAAVDVVSGAGYEHVNTLVEVSMRPSEESPQSKPQTYQPVPSASVPVVQPLHGQAPLVAPVETLGGVWEPSDPPQPYRLMLRYGFLGGSELNEQNHEFNTFMDGDSFALRLSRPFKDSQAFWLLEGRTATRTDLVRWGGRVERTNARLTTGALGLGYQWDIGIFHPRLIGSLVKSWLKYESRTNPSDCGAYECPVTELVWRRSPYGFDVMVEAAIDLYGPLAVVPSFRAGYASTDTLSLESREAGLALEFTF